MISYLVKKLWNHTLKIYKKYEKRQLQKIEKFIKFSKTDQVHEKIYTQL